ncbi:MAG: hypothetical protein ACOYMV_14435, partial [Verrucomicrobiia bacterium]
MNITDSPSASLQIISLQGDGRLLGLLSQERGSFQHRLTRLPSRVEAKSHGISAELGNGKVRKSINSGGRFARFQTLESTMKALVVAIILLALSRASAGDASLESLPKPEEVFTIACEPGSKQLAAYFSAASLLKAL